MADTISVDILESTSESTLYINASLSSGLNTLLPSLSKDFITTISARILTSLRLSDFLNNIFFSDRYYGYDDGIYAALRVLELICDNYSLDDFLNSLPKTFSTQEIKINCPDEVKFSIIKDLSLLLDKAGLIVNKIDGLRVQKDSGWWLLRASNTQAVLVARIEADSQDSLNKLQEELSYYLKKFDLSLK